jgi:hypothetical protein
VSCGDATRGGARGHPAKPADGLRETRDDFAPPSRRVAVVLDAELLVLDASIVTPERLVRADRPVIAVAAAARVPANGAAA